MFNVYFLIASHCTLVTSGKYDTNHLLILFIFFVFNFSATLQLHVPDKNWMGTVGFFFFWKRLLADVKKGSQPKPRDVLESQGKRFFFFFFSQF